MNGQIIDSSRIAFRIKQIRKSKGLTQEEMGEKLGYSQRQVRRLESSGTMNLEVINTLARVFNLSTKSILFDDENAFVFIGQNMSFSKLIKWDII